MKFIVRSLLILLALYGLVFALGDMFLAHEHASVWWAVGFSVGIIGLQYLVGPWFIEWLLAIVWDDGANLLPAENREFVAKLCAERGIKVPRMGIIYSGTPNAFSFGHTPGNARVVITKGLLDILTPEETNAVLAHEIGHVEHWDFAVMAVAALAPLLLYQIWVFTRSNNNSRLVAWTAYLCYWVSQFIVLLLNRTREFMADRYAAHVTGEPNVLSSALVKIACGLVHSEGEYAEKMKSGSKEEKKTLRREQRLGGALAVMGISNVRSGAALALGGANPAEAAAVMQWDLVNPWARMYELNSTHPLTAFRVLALNEDSTALHQTTQYPLPADRRIAWGRFPFEVVLWAAPVIAAWALFFGFTSEHWFGAHGLDVTPDIAAKLLVFTGAAWILRTWYRYHGEVQPATIGTLIRDTEVSQMRARAVRVTGEIVGRGVPGAFWSPDLVLRDDTGMLFILYRQTIPFARLLFALNADEYIGQSVVIEGWFRRGLRPYIEMSSLTTNDGKTRRAWSRWVQYLLAAGAMAGGYLWLSAIG
jgi:Zn-dependent protease with chaperone function